MTDSSRRIRLWGRWIAANAVGEMLGLGATFAAMALASSRLEGYPGAGNAPLMLLLAVAGGALEATLVGLAQWWAMHPWFPAIPRCAWWLATVVGALVAYLLGYLPSTLMSLGEEASQTPAVEPPQWLVLLLSAALGLIAGAVLSFAQWWVLRKHVARAGWWVPAHMLAWLVGMPIIFWGIDLAQAGRPLAQMVGLLAGCLLLTGSVVGAIHGTVVVALAGPRR